MTRLLNGITKRSSQLKPSNSVLVLQCGCSPYSHNVVKILAWYQHLAVCL